MSAANQPLREFLNHYLGNDDDFLSVLPLAVVLVELRPRVRLAYVSAQFEALTGYPSSVLLADLEHSRQIVFSEDVDAIDRGIRNLRREGDRFSCEFRLRRADGEIRWLACEAVARSGAPGSLAVVFTLADVTSRKTTELALDAERKARASLIEALPGVVYELSLDADGWKLSYLSPQVRALSGYDRDELVGHPEPIPRMVHADDLGAVAAAIQQTRDHGTSGECVYRIVRKDGTLAWVRNRWSVVAAPSPQSLHLRGIVTDVSEQRAAEARAQESVRLYQRLIEHIPGFVFVVRIEDGELTLVYLSPQGREFFGRDLDGIVGGPVTDGAGLVDLEDLPGVLEMVRRMVETREPSRIDVRFVMPDGSRKWTRTEASVISEPGQAAVDILGVGHDVTAEHEAEERTRRERELETRLMRADRLNAVGQLAAGIAHEVNNALASLLPYGSLLAIDPGLPEYARDHGRKIEEHAHRIAAIIRGLLNLARQQLPKKAVWPLEELVGDTLMLVGAEARRADIEIRSRLEPGITVFGDRGQLQQVILNLLSNGIEAIVDRSVRWLEISATRNDDAAEIRVVDSGPGVSPEIRDQLFTGFVTTRENGSGLGLSISASIVKAHGGELRLDESHGPGACFVVSLPAGDAAAPSADQAAPLPVVESDRPIRALVVDDETGVRMGFAKLLRRFGVEAVTASDGTQALERLGRESFDVIFLDLRMPGMSGMDVYEALRRTKPDDARRVVLMTADAASLEVRVFLDAVDRPVLHKPFDLGTVRDAIVRASGFTALHLDS